METVLGNILPLSPLNNGGSSHDLVKWRAGSTGQLGAAQLDTTLRHALVLTVRYSGR